MAKSKKIVAEAFRLVRSPLKLTLELYSSTTGSISTVAPEVVQLLNKIVKHDDQKTQKQAMKQLKQFIEKLSEDHAVRLPLAHLLVACFLDLGFVAIRTELMNVLTLMQKDAARVLSDKEKMHRLVFNPDLPLSHVDSMYSGYLDVLHKFSITIGEEEQRRIFQTLVAKFAAGLVKQAQTATYNVAEIDE